jgi:hypothetical protein
MAEFPCPVVARKKSTAALVKPEELIGLVQKICAANQRKDFRVFVSADPWVPMREVLYAMGASQKSKCAVQFTPAVTMDFESLKKENALGNWPPDEARCGSRVETSGLGVRKIKIDPEGKLRRNKVSNRTILRHIASTGKGEPGSLVALRDAFGSKKRLEEAFNSKIDTRGLKKPLPRIRLGKVNVRAARGYRKGAVRQVLRRRQGALRYCYAKLGKTDEPWSGRAKLKFTINANGRATKLVFRPKMGEPRALAKLGDCITRKASSWRFPKPGVGEHVVVGANLLFPRSGKTRK